MIQKEGDKWCVIADSGKKMGCYPSKEEAEERLKEIEMFKHMEEEEDEDLIELGAKRKDVSKADKEQAVEEYGNVTYADPVNKKYPIDTEEHIRAAWNYINKEKNAGKYSAEDVKKIKSRIVSAWKKTIDKEGPPSASMGEIKGGEEEINEILHTVPTILEESVSNGTGWNDLIMDGNYRDMHGQPVEVTQETLQEYLNNFNEGVRGQDLPITFDHPAKGGISAGWMRSLRIVDRKVKDQMKKVLQTLIDWTPIGTEKVKNKEYRYISAEILPKNILKAASLVNFPAVKGMNPVELGEDKDGYKHIYLMGGDVSMEDQEIFTNSIVDKIVDKLQSFFLAEKEKEKGKVKKHLPDNEEGKQWCIFMDGKQLSCGPDEAWADEQLKPKQMEEEKPIVEEPNEASENEQGGENENMEETTKLIEEKVAEAIKPLAEENKALKEKLEVTTTNLAEEMAARKQEKLKARVAEALKIDNTKQYVPAVSEALTAAVLAEPKDYESMVFDLLELLKNPTSVVSLAEIGTAAETETIPEKDTTAFSEKVDARAAEIQKEKSCDYLTAAKLALAELNQISD